ncbi:MAG: chromosome segregation protein SMC [Acidimicrobiia bacterium]
MFLKTLTLKGFKSFAEKTTLTFEPGVTVVVGPNGSGKSNVVDAVAWVLGAQGPRTVRGGKMEDVIFAGTPERQALGRAEVSLTIDNSSGVLPIEFTEVTITRLLFRSGESEYQINGAPCRLLDVQELLSDSGIGRQQHVIVGQGQLDAILNARPEDRRAVIEEAAGILKFRKRREKAERRLEGTESSLLRLNDTLREVRRQLTPLARQADAARRHDGIAEELRAIRTHLLGHELAGLQTRLTRLTDDKATFTTRDAEVRHELATVDVAILDAERSLSTLGDEELDEWLVRVEALRERARGLSALLAEKSRGIARELDAAADEGVVETLVADADAVRAQLQALAGDAAALAPELTTLEQTEREVAVARQELPDAADVGNAAETLAGVRNELVARTEALQRAERERERLAARIAATHERVNALAAELANLQGELQTALAAASPLEDAANRAALARVSADEALRGAEQQWRTAESDAASWRARAEALALALESARRRAGAERLVGLVGIAGPLVDHLEIEPGAEAGVAAALGDAMHAVVVEGGDAARRAVDRLKEGDAEALLLIVDAATSAAPRALAPAGTRLLADCVTSRIPGLGVALSHLLANAVMIDGDWRRALDIALANPGAVVVTTNGDRFGGRTVWRSGGAASSAATQAALDEAVERAAQAEQDRNAAEGAVQHARAQLAQATNVADAADEERRKNAQRIEAMQRTATRIEAERAERSADGENLANEHTALDAQYQRDASAVAEVSARIPQLETDAADVTARLAQIRERQAAFEQRAEAVRTLRRDLEVRAAAIEERRAVLSRRLAEVEERLARNPEKQAEAERRRTQLTARRRACEQVQQRLGGRLEEIAALHDRLHDRKREQTEAARASTTQLTTLRTQRQSLERELTEVRERASRNEIETAETKLRLENCVERIRAEFDCEPQAVMDAPAPEVPEGTTLAGRARELERELKLMGPINPLALEEYDELQERHTFLQEQLEDVKNTRRELQKLIKAVDEEISTVFAQAFADVQAHFAELFTTLFPGGSGRIFLVDPSDLLNSGIEIEARPSGKNLRRLSLLSGGERSLTAMAFLFAVFRSRPSPFYLMDEVEAALDDVNLGRFLDLIEEFRNEAQLVIVSHQKRTMDSADALYGVSMPPGGSSRVVSERVRGVQLDLTQADEMSEQ